MNENKIYKNYKKTMKIMPEMQQGDVTNVVVYSFDYDTSKFTFQLKKNGELLGLSNAAVINNTLYFGGDSDNYPKAVLNGIVEDDIKSIESFVIPKQYLGFEGRVLGEVSIEFTNGQTMVVGYFSFMMKPSYINGSLEITQQVYVERFEDLENMIKGQSEKIDSILSEMKKQLDTFQPQIDDINQKIKDGDIVTKNEFNEVIDSARYSVFYNKTFDSLGERFDYIDSKYYHLDSFKIDTTRSLWTSELSSNFEITFINETTNYDKYYPIVIAEIGNSESTERFKTNVLSTI